MASEDRDAIGGGLLRASDAADLGTWAGDELRLALSRIETIGREIQHIEISLKVQQDEVARLADSVHVVDGRTQRHEVGQEQTREVRHALAEMTQRLVDESSLRRELAAQVERATQRDSDAQRELQRVLEVIASRLDDMENRITADLHRQRAMAADVASVEHEGDGVEARVERLEHRIAAESESLRHQGAEVARVASAITQIVSTLDAIEARARTMQADQRRLDEDVAALRFVRNREEELLDIIEQQRATRARLEDRVNQVEEAMEAVRRGLATAAEERQVLARQIAGEVEHRREFDNRLEAQRDLFIEHLRRQARADEDASRRMIEEIERDLRATRSLLVRLTEESGEVDQEQPL